ncbi:glycosyltransferase family 1 protein [Orrella sp. JC864]|uniref:glycosyltransferase family 4 protein n=1 Tax=Orrella sp. JC864 TaxID=3120298 RepID=UPI00300A9E5B
MHILLVSDAWHPQVSGVVRTWTSVQRVLAGWGHTLEVIGPSGSLTIPAPSERALRLCINPGRHLRRLLGARVPDALHIATEGPLGMAARSLALARGWRFTTSFHTAFPEYLQLRMGVPAALTYRYLRWFHRPSQKVLVPTHTLRTQLAAHGFANMQVWARGVDARQFAPDDGLALAGLPRPIHLSVGRLAREKNLDAFLALELPGSKVVAGDGPDAARLRKQYPDAVFLGMVPHDRLAPLYSAADVFVFPSLTDTFGLVMLEAMACGTPVAALPGAAPCAVVEEGVTGCVHADLARACHGALGLDRQQVRERTLGRTWDVIAGELLDALVPLAPAHRTADAPQVAGIQCGLPEERCDGSRVVR